MRLKVIQTSTYVGEDYWDWDIRFEGDKADLDQIKYVEYILHETFADPIRKIKDRSSGFKLETSGWGTFRVYFTIMLKDGSGKEDSLNISFDKVREKEIVI
jgi:transcription initiation factor IIF auxiliary subunit